MPAPYAIADFANAIPQVLQDGAGKLWTGATQVAVLSAFVSRALDRYSKDSPLVVTNDQDATGTTQVTLPVAPGPIAVGLNVPVFDPLFSQVLQIEYPVAQQPPQYIDPTDFRLYQQPTGYIILLTQDSLVPNGTMRLTWTARHTPDGSTVPDMDFYAVVDFAASLAAEQLATIYAQTVDPTFSADVVNYRSKSQEYQSLAKMLRKRYFNHLGVDESSTGDAETRPAIAIGQQYLDMASGVGRLIHTKYTR